MVWKKTGVWGLRRRAAIRCVFLGDNPTRPQVEVLALVRGVVEHTRDEADVVGRQHRWTGMRLLCVCSA